MFCRHDRRDCQVSFSFRNYHFSSIVYQFTIIVIIKYFLLKLNRTIENKTGFNYIPPPDFGIRTDSVETGEDEESTERCKYKNECFCKVPEIFEQGSVSYVTRLTFCNKKRKEKSTYILAFPLFCTVVCPL